MTWMGIESHRGHRQMQVAGGPQQRVAVCRALALDPPPLLADEPTGKLDSTAAKQVLVVLRQLRQLQQAGRTLIVVTHDRAVASIATRTIQIFGWRRPDGPMQGARSSPRPSR